MSQHRTYDSVESSTRGSAHRRKHTQTETNLDDNRGKSWHTFFFGVLLGAVVTKLLASFRRTPISTLQSPESLPILANQEGETLPTLLPSVSYVEAATFQLGFANLAYCGSDYYTQMDFDALEDKRYQNFNVTKVLFSALHDTEGFVGVVLVNDSNAFPASVGDISVSDISVGDIQVSFRGSSSPQNFVGDLLVWMDKNSLTHCEGCSVHAGFDAAFQSVKVELLESVLEAAKAGEAAGKRPMIRIAGHSLGAALAVLAAYEISNDSSITARISGIEVVTFGSPRIGNKVFSDAYDSAVPTSIRIVNKDDIIPRTPIRSFGYEHEGEEIWTRPSDNANVICTHEDPNCSDGVSMLDLNIEDHSYALGVKLDCPFTKTP